MQKNNIEIKVKFIGADYCPKLNPVFKFESFFEDGNLGIHTMEYNESGRIFTRSYYDVESFSASEIKTKIAYCTNT